MGTTDHGAHLRAEAQDHDRCEPHSAAQQPLPWPSNHPPSSRPGWDRVVGEGGAGCLEPPAQGLGREVCGTEDGGGDAVKAEAGVGEEEAKR